jgi:hypothetical protein
MWLFLASKFKCKWDREGYKDDQGMNIEICSNSWGSWSEIFSEVGSFQNAWYYAYVICMLAVVLCWFEW